MLTAADVAPPSCGGGGRGGGVAGMLPAVVDADGGIGGGGGGVCVSRVSLPFNAIFSRRRCHSVGSTSYIAISR